MEVSGSRVGILGQTHQLQGDKGGVFPEVQSIVLLLISAYILFSGLHGVLGVCLLVLSK